VGSAASRRLLPEGLALTGLAAEPDCLRIRATTETPRAHCPVCGRRSARIHSRYGRAIADLPWRELAVRLEIRARKFFCDEPSCERRIFCERLPDVAAHARKTDRLEEALLAIVLELGGRSGAGLARELGFVVGRDALLLWAKRSVPAHLGKVRMLEVDDLRRETDCGRGREVRWRRHPGELRRDIPLQAGAGDLP
jgi:hypothetical protein